MGIITPPQKVKLIIGIISAYPELILPLESALVKKFGPIDHRAGPFPFNFTDYYEAEMGKGLNRWFGSFKKLIAPDNIARIKIWTNRLEEKFVHLTPKYLKVATIPSLTGSRQRDEGQGEPLSISRPINLDPGYLTAAKLVLFSTKDYSHRIYLSGGIYAEVTLQYSRGQYQPLPWTYPDYQTPPYLEFFQHVRQNYLAQLKQP